jgi:hypothetical protein
MPTAYDEEDVDDVQDDAGDDVPESAPSSGGSLRETLAAQFEVLSNADDQAGAGVAPETAGDPAEGGAADGEPAPKDAPARSRDPKGRFTPEQRAAAAKALAKAKPAVPGKTPAPVKPPAAAAAKPPPPADGNTDDQTDGVVRPPEPKLPQSWSPAAREALKKADPVVLKEVLRREGEMNRALSEGAGERKLGQTFRQMAEPYANHFRARGVDVTKATHEALQFRYSMETAHPQAQAQMIAGLVKGFGVPVEVLAQAIDATESGGGHQQNQPAHLDPRQLVQQVTENVTNSFRQRAEAQKAERITREVEAMSEDTENFPHFNQVRDEMRLQMIAAAEAGRTLTLSDAYHRAVKLDTELSRAQEQEQAQERARNAAASTAKARAAAVSVRSRPVGPSQQGQPKTIRGALNAALASHNSRTR